MKKFPGVAVALVVALLFGPSFAGPLDDAKALLKDGKSAEGAEVLEPEGRRGADAAVPGAGGLEAVGCDV
ncbi:MAG: hypothetical protein K8T20_11000 [Planctomycetes bacterium]|nr:hypothetical protein [Planctomycetota bacterium]